MIIFEEKDVVTCFTVNLFQLQDPNNYYGRKLKTTEKD